MKLILNDSTLEITSRDTENRHKVVTDFTISSGNKWQKSDSSSKLHDAYFIDAKAGDVITVKRTASRYMIAFTANESPVVNEDVVFANGTSSRIRESGEHTYNVSENCYLYVLVTFIDANGNAQDYEPDSIVINGITLDENGFL